MKPSLQTIFVLKSLFSTKRTNIVLIILQIMGKANVISFSNIYNFILFYLVCFKNALRLIERCIGKKIKFGTNY